MVDRSGQIFDVDKRLKIAILYCRFANVIGCQLILFVVRLLIFAEPDRLASQNIMQLRLYAHA